MRVTIQDSAIMPEAFFTVDGDSYLPDVMTRGPWGAAMGGQIVGGLLGWGIERSGIDPEFQPARFTVDLLRPVLIAPVQIETSVQREGQRIRVVDGALMQNGTTVARASALFLRRGDHPDGQVWSSPVEMPPLRRTPMASRRTCRFSSGATGPPSGAVPVSRRASGSNPTPRSSRGRGCFGRWCKATPSHRLPVSHSSVISPAR